MFPPSLILNSLKEAQAIKEQVMPLAAIWMEKPMQLKDGSKTYRIVPGMEIQINDTFYTVEDCTGNINNTRLFLHLSQPGVKEEFVLNVRN